MVLDVHGVLLEKLFTVPSVLSVVGTIDKELAYSSSQLRCENCFAFGEIRNKRVEAAAGGNSILQQVCCEGLTEPIT